MTVKSLYNQKPWITKAIWDAINTCTTAYNLGRLSGNMDNYKAAAYNITGPVKQAKRDSGKKVELQF